MRSVVSQTEIEDLFEILGSNLPVGVCIIQDEKFRYINPNFLIYTGYREDELLGKDFLTIVIPEDREMARENATKMLKEELASPYQFRVACKDGSSKWVMGAVRIRPVPWERSNSGNLQGYHRAQAGRRET